VVVALIERFPLKRARALLTHFVEGLVDNMLGESPTGLAESPTGLAAKELAPNESLTSELLLDPAFIGVAATPEREGMRISWRTTEEQLSCARGIASGTRSLRMILVRKSGIDVAVDTLDLGEVAAEGARLVPSVPGLLRAVASVGLLDGGRFVSMAHASVA
jgi:hypothetical protein